MKKLVSTLVFALCGLFLFAQTNATTPKGDPNLAPNDAEARAATEKLSAKYGLNADQAKQVYGIQARKQRNMAEIEGFKTSNPPLYRLKLESIQKGTFASLRRVLQTKEQIAIFDQTQANIRQQRATKRKELVLQGAAKDAVEAALLDIYEE